MKFIAIVGTKWQGKDTFADFLCEELAKADKKVYRVALGDYIKHGLATAFCLDAEQIFYDQSTKELPRGFLNGHSARHLLQQFGTEFCQKLLGKTIWLETLMRDIRSRRTEGYDFDYCVVTDVRFEHEFNFFDSSQNEEIVFVHRDFDLEPKTLLQRWFGPKTHISEKGLYHRYLPKVHAWIDNTGTLEDLRFAAQEYVHFRLGVTTNA